MTIITHPTNENLRIRTEIEQAPPKPYNDGGFPIWRIEPGNYGSRAVQEDEITSYETPAALDYGITQMLERDESRDKTLLARYLRIFWGVTFTQWWHSGAYWYLTCDPADWREKVGVPEFSTRTLGYADDPFAEWEAWVEGDVHYAIPEQRVQREVKTTTIYPDGNVDHDFRSYEDWEESAEGAVGGFYGDVDQAMAATMAWQFGWEIPDGHRFTITEQD